MLLDGDQLRFSAILTSTISSLCNHGLGSGAVMHVDGLLGITLASGDVFLVNIHEQFDAATARSGRQRSTTSTVEHSSTRHRNPSAKDDFQIQANDDDDDDDDDQVDLQNIGGHYSGSVGEVASPALKELLRGIPSNTKPCIPESSGMANNGLVACCDTACDGTTSVNNNNVMNIDYVGAAAAVAPIVHTRTTSCLPVPESSFSATATIQSHVGTQDSVKGCTNTCLPSSCSRTLAADGVGEFDLKVECCDIDDAEENSLSIESTRMDVLTSGSVFLTNLLTQDTQGLNCPLPSRGHCIPRLSSFSHSSTTSAPVGDSARQAGVVVCTSNVQPTRNQSKNYSHDTLMQAVRLVREGVLSGKQVQKVLGVPRATTYRVLAKLHPDWKAKRAQQQRNPVAFEHEHLQ
jgi:hypothetical protein